MSCVNRLSLPTLRWMDQWPSKTGNWQGAKFGHFYPDTGVRITLLSLTDTNISQYQSVILAMIMLMGLFYQSQLKNLLCNQFPSLSLTSAHDKMTWPIFVHLSWLTKVDERDWFDFRSIWISATVLTVCNKSTKSIQIQFTHCFSICYKQNSQCNFHLFLFVNSSHVILLLQS